jgi:hypothetical protein
MLAKAKWQVSTIQVLEEVFEERLRQVARYGHNDECADGAGPETRWLLPLSSASAAEIQVALRSSYEAFEEETGAPTWVHLVLEEVCEAFEAATPDRLEEELLQVAALCVSWVESLRRRGAKPVPAEPDELSDLL